MKGLLIVLVILLILLGLLGGGGYYAYKKGLLDSQVSKAKEIIVAKGLDKYLAKVGVNITTGDNKSAEPPPYVFQQINPNNPYFQAVQNGTVTDLEALYKTIPNEVNVRDYSGWTPLQYAINDNSKDKTNSLLQHNANINNRDGLGNTPMMYKIKSWDNDMVRELLQDRADPNVKNINGQNSVHYSVLFNNPGALKAIEGFGAELDEKDNFGNTPLAYSVYTEETYPMMQYLVENNADIESRNNLGQTPLMQAALHGNFKAVKYLIENRADVMAQSNSGDTALSYALKNGHEKVSTFLKFIGADPKSGDGANENNTNTDSNSTGTPLNGTNTTEQPALPPIKDNVTQ